MNFRTIIYHSIKGNLNILKGYYMVTSFSVMVFFMVGMLLQHPSIPLKSMHLTFQEAAKGVNLIAFIFLSLFILYSAHTYVRLRSKDYALFKIIGMKSRHLNLLLLGENLFVYVTGLFTGVAMGLLLVKLLFMFISKLLDLGEIALYWPVEPLLQTLKYFGGVYVLISVLSYFYLKRMEVKEVLQLKRKRQRLSRPNLYITSLSLLLLAAGYIMILMAGKNNLLHFIIPSILATTAGTFFFYQQGVSFLLQKMKQNKKYYYKGGNILWISGLAYRVRDFALVLFLTTLIMTVGLVALSAFYSIGYHALNLKTEKTYPLVVVSDSINSEKFANLAQQVLVMHETPFERKELFAKAKTATRKNNELFIAESAMVAFDSTFAPHIHVKHQREGYRLVKV